MDKAKSNSPRKQKQLGPAPIASFDTSFETSSDELKIKVNALEVETKSKNTHTHTYTYRAPHSLEKKNETPLLQQEQEGRKQTSKENDGTNNNTKSIFNIWFELIGNLCVRIRALQ